MIYRTSRNRRRPLIRAALPVGSMAGGQLAKQGWPKKIKIKLRAAAPIAGSTVLPVTVEAVEAVPKTEGFLAGTLEIDLDFSLSTLEGEPEILNML